MWVVNNYDIRTKPRFLTELNKIHSEPNQSFFSKNQTETEIKNLFRTSLITVVSLIITVLKK